MYWDEMPMRENPGPGTADKRLTETEGVMENY